MGEALHLPPPRRVDIGVGVDPGGKVVAEGIGRDRLEGRVGLVQRPAVHRHPAILDANPVAGNAHHALDQIRRIGMVEDDDVAALDVAVGQEPAAQVPRPPAGAKICLFTSRKSPTSSVCSMLSEGMRKG